jgi:hypothetical protein
MIIKLVKKLLSLFGPTYKLSEIYKNSDVKQYANINLKEDWLHLLESNGGPYTHIVTILENVTNGDLDHMNPDGDYFIVSIKPLVDPELDSLLEVYG